MSKNIYHISGYTYFCGDLTNRHNYLLPALLAELERLDGCEQRLFDLGCRNGSIGVAVSKQGWEVTGVDVSSEGIAQASRVHPELRLETGFAHEDLEVKYGTFPAVVSLEVVKHLYDPRTLFNRLEPGGTAIVSTPYHGYWKNPVMAITGRMDALFYALWEHGHINFGRSPH